MIVSSAFLDSIAPIFLSAAAAASAFAFVISLALSFSSCS